MLKLKKFCIAHTAPLYKLPDDMHIIGMSNYEGHNNVTHIKDIDPNMDALHPFLASSAACFSLCNLIEDLQESYDYIQLFSYRRFFSHQIIGVDASFGNNRIVSEKILSSIEYSSLFSNLDQPFIFAKPVAFHSIYDQYNTAHHGIDLLRYLALAVEHDLIASEEVMSFLQDQTLIPFGLEMGQFPISFFLTHQKKMREICIDYLKLHLPVDLTRYQRRALNFCNERMGSYLLKKHLQITYAGLPHDFIATPYLINNNLTYERNNT